MWECSDNCLVCDPGSLNDSTVCTQCSPGYYLGSVSDTCSKCNSSCKECSDSSNTDCTACRDGYVLSLGVCEPCPPSCQQCYWSTESSTAYYQCVTCSPGFHMAHAFSGPSHCICDRFGQNDNNAISTNLQMLIDSYSYQCVPSNLCPVTWQYDFYGDAPGDYYEENSGYCNRRYGIIDDVNLHPEDEPEASDWHMYVSFNWYQMSYTYDVFVNGREAPWPYVVDRLPSADRRLGQEAGDTSAYTGSERAATLEQTSVRQIGQRGAYLDGTNDYYKLTNWTISGPFIVGALMQPQCTDCFLISIPLQFSDAWTDFEVNKNRDSFYEHSREPLLGEFVAYMEMGFVKAKLKIGNDYFYFSGNNVMPENEWITVALAMQPDVDSQDDGGDSSELLYSNNKFNYYLVVMTETSSASYDANDVVNQNYVHKIGAPVNYYPVWNPDQEVYFGTYDGAPYKNYRGYIADWISGTTFNVIDLESLDDSDSTYTSLNTFFWSVDGSVDEVNNPWLECDFGTYYHLDDTTPTCSFCHASCLFGCDSAEACDSNGYDITYETIDASSTCAFSVVDGKGASGWSDDETQNCRGCRGHAVLEGRQTNDGMYTTGSVVRSEGICVCPDGFEGDAYGCQPCCVVGCSICSGIEKHECTVCEDGWQMAYDASNLTDAERGDGGHNNSFYYNECIPCPDGVCYNSQAAFVYGEGGTSPLSGTSWHCLP